MITLGTPIVFAEARPNTESAEEHTNRSIHFRERVVAQRKQGHHPAFPWQLLRGNCKNNHVLQVETVTNPSMLLAETKHQYFRALPTAPRL